MTRTRSCVKEIITGIVLISGVLLTGCDILNDLIDGSNRTPVISNVSANPVTVETGGTVRLDVFATDADGDNLEYIWTATAG